jgi:hypothetical protein
MPSVFLACLNSLVKAPFENKVALHEHNHYGDCSYKNYDIRHGTPVFVPS